MKVCIGPRAQCMRVVVWKPLCLDPSDGVFGRFDLAALCGCHTLNVCCCCCGGGGGEGFSAVHPCIRTCLPKSLTWES